LPSSRKALRAVIVAKRKTSRVAVRRRAGWPEWAMVGLGGTEISLFEDHLVYEHALQVHAGPHCVKKEIGLSKSTLDIDDQRRLTPRLCI